MIIHNSEVLDNFVPAAVKIDSQNHTSVKQDCHSLEIDNDWDNSANVNPAFRESYEKSPLTCQVQNNPLSSLNPLIKLYRLYMKKMEGLDSSVTFGGVQQMLNEYQENSTELSGVEGSNSEEEVSTEASMSMLPVSLLFSFSFSHQVN